MSKSDSMVGIPRSQALYMICRACDSVRKIGRQHCGNPIDCSFVKDIMRMWEDKGIVENTLRTDADRALKEYYETPKSEFTWLKLLGWIEPLAKGYGELYRKLEAAELKIQELKDDFDDVCDDDNDEGHCRKCEDCDHCDDDYSDYPLAFE